MRVLPFHVELAILQKGGGDQLASFCPVSPCSVSRHSIMALTEKQTSALSAQYSVILILNFAASGIVKINFSLSIIQSKLFCFSGTKN